MKVKHYMRGIILVAVFLAAGLLSGSTSYAETKNGWHDGYFYVNNVKQKSKWVKDKYGTYYVNSSGKKVTGWIKVKGRYHYLNEGKNGKLRNSRKKTGVRLSTLSNDVITVGVDMSTYQGKVDWKKIKSAGVDFVMLRIGYGKGRFGNAACELDNRFKSYVEGAESVGIPIGVYFYTYAKTPKEALEEAQFTIEQLDGVNVSFPVAYDIEDASIISATNTATRTEMCKTFMDTIEAAGYTPMLYSNLNWYTNYLDAEELKDYEFWYARYTYVEPDRNEIDYGMWQATSTQRLSGITENTVDLDFLYKDYFSMVKPRDTALKYGWHKESGKWYYYYRGKRHETGWFSLAGKKYYLNNGAAATGWKTLSDKKYYFNSKGEMQTGFVPINGKIYLFDKSGVMQTSTDVQGVRINEDGSCEITKGWYKNSKGKYFYRYSSGKIAKSKWLTIKGKKYYCDSKGYRVTGFKIIKGKRYYFSSNGVMKKGWLTYKGRKYYFQKNGQMVKNKTIRIKGKRYKFNKKGQLV